MAQAITERRTFRLLPDEDIGFSRPAIEYETAEGEVRVRVSHDFKHPEPELARKADDPGWWIVSVWLPLGAKPLALIADPDAITL
ncbi:MAG: hypothetical protein JWM90_2446 [Thermoleophilia bacterium]|nr:hypothetical protein [Thermoleophilia bacterium]